MRATPGTISDLDGAANMSKSSYRYQGAYMDKIEVSNFNHAVCYWFCFGKQHKRDGRSRISHPLYGERKAVIYAGVSETITALAGPAATRVFANLRPSRMAGLSIR